MAAATMFIMLVKRLDGANRHFARTQAAERLINDKCTEGGNQ